MSDMDFIGHCYVCDKKIRQHDLDQLSREDFTKIIQKVLEEISTNYMIVMKENDGLCGMCRNLVARISKLQAELRTTSLGLRALLRLKYSLPPPAMGHIEHPKVQATFKQSSSSRESRSAVLEVAKDNVTKTGKTFIDLKKHKITQTTQNTVAHKHKKTQTDEGSAWKKSKLEVKIVSSINEVEHLETEYLQEEDDGRNNETLVNTSSCNEGINSLFEDISDVTELTTLLNNDYIAEESEIVTENEIQDDSLEEVKQSVNRKLVKNEINFGFLKCARCDFITRSTEELKTHMLSFKNKEGYYCSICDFAFHKHNHFGAHQISHSEISKNIRCFFCDEVVHDKLHMRFHLEAKHRPNSFTHRCSICNHVFMFAPTLRKHRRLRHKVRATFKCEKCENSFSDKIKYNNHVEYYHRDSLNCKYCQRQYFTIAKLITHENSSHRFDRTQYHQCRYCPKRFVRQDLLTRHEKRHMEQFEHRCDLCGHGFHEPELLENHIRKCKVFLRSVKSVTIKPIKPLSWRTVLKQRLRKYQRDPHGRHDSSVCDVCGKIIVHRQRYKIHREMHDGPTSFQCHVCGKKFRYMSNMSAHIKNLHKDTDNAE